jgi:alkaline phosphatase D
MSDLKRRKFIRLAAALAATPAWAHLSPAGSDAQATERRDLFPEGVASGDPEPHSVILWTRRPFGPSTLEATSRQAQLTVEVSEDISFKHVVVTTVVPVRAAADWTARVLVGNLKADNVYWYRFVDTEGHASRIGRTITAPLESDGRPRRFAVVSCQNANMGSQHAYRRMIYEDERAAAEDRLAFVLHLGDFIYEIVWYPPDRPQGMYGRRLYDIVRYPKGERIADYHVPASLEDYRAIYQSYLHDPDVQDARARWPFVCMWDNHEFSIYGWQSIQVFDGKKRPAQSRKVAANQAWFEYQPSRAVKASGPDLTEFAPPTVQDAPVERFDDQGLGDEPNNRIALGSLTGYRTLHFGRHVELILTDQRSYRSEEPVGRPEVQALMSEHFPEMIPEEVLEILDAGRSYANGHPPESIRVGEHEISNFRKDAPPQTILGAKQKAWFLERLRKSTATWKIWGNTLGTLDYRVDPQNLPAGLTAPWPVSGYAGFRSPDAATAFLERAEIYRAVRDAGVSGFVTVAGDRHSFWAGCSMATLPPRACEPVGVAFVVGSISAIGPLEKLEKTLPLNHPLRALYLKDCQGAAPEPTVNFLLRHGVRACLEYARTGDLELARRLSNPELAPHLSFLDLGGHGYMVVWADERRLDVEFICIPRPAEATRAPDGGPLRYRVRHRVPRWSAGDPPRMQVTVLEGNPAWSV